MFSNKERKLKRLDSVSGVELNGRTYNLVLGLAVIYGLIVNVIMVKNANALNIPFSFIGIGSFIIMMIGSMMSAVSKNPIVSFFGYNLIIIPTGAMLSITVNFFGEDVISRAITATAAITIGMIVLSQVIPNFFLSIRNALFGSLMISIIVELFFFFTASIAPMWYEIAMVLLFSMYIGYDMSKAQMYPKNIDNAIDCAVDLYLDIINIFLRLLSIFARMKSSD